MRAVYPTLMFFTSVIAETEGVYPLPCFNKCTAAKYKGKQLQFDDMYSQYGYVNRIRRIHMFIRVVFRCNPTSPLLFLVPISIFFPPAVTINHQLVRNFIHSTAEIN